MQIFYHLGLAWGLRWADSEYSTFFNGNPKVLSDHVIPTMDQVITQSEWAFFVYNIYVNMCNCSLYILIVGDI